MIRAEYAVLIPKKNLSIAGKETASELLFGFSSFLAIIIVVRENNVIVQHGDKNAGVLAKLIQVLEHSKSNSS